MAELSGAFEALLRRFAGSLAQRLGEDLCAVVLFGQGVQVLRAPSPEAAPRPRQIDVLVVGRELPASRWDRHDLVYEALLGLEAERDDFAGETGWAPCFAVHLKTRQELGESGPLPPAFEDAWVVTDPDGVFAAWHRELQERWQGAGVRQLGRGDRVYWDLAPSPDGPRQVPRRYQELARGYLKQAESRMRVTRMAMEEGNYAYVVRAAQEAVELSLKAMLAQVGVDPPTWHDVGREIREHAGRFPDLDAGIAEELAAISSKLREHRGPSVYGDRLERLPPDRLFSEYDARVSRDWSRQVFEIALETVNALSLRR